MASELLNLLPGGRLKVFHHCMEGTCCMLKMFFFCFICIWTFVCLVGLVCSVLFLVLLFCMFAV